MNNEIIYQQNIIIYINIIVESMLQVFKLMLAA